ncbi:MAG: TIGR04282 family arsenosugar biosynthesis glycosyltransferase [Magnetococcales bacterium]|nr:TIGR04282 family arsenosugar biosynthesis glycosyltransferase [Magnetococcales bacterium]MBF0346646.1 TIGR04282 family arsenosugar biosynthesis glycosyltransferase [Magnetococcales bacterium]
MGKVKTRLIPLLGPLGATRAHERLLTHVVHIARAWCHAASNRQFLLWCTPNTHHPFFDGLIPPHQRRPQPEGDLGHRLATIVVRQLKHHQGVILLGGDCVSITLPILDQTLAALLHHDAVMVPAEDGGYLLLALTRHHPSLFANIPWGSATVAAETRIRLNGLGWRWHELAAGWDVDHPRDWLRFQSMIRKT